MRSTRSTIDSTDTTSRGDNSTLALTIAYHPDINRVGQRALLMDANANKAVHVSRDEPAFCVPGESSGESLADEYISRSPIIVSSAPNGGIRLDVAQTSTKVRIRGQRIAGSVLFSAEDIARGVTLLLGKRIVLVLHRTQLLARVIEHQDVPELIGESDGLCRVLWDIKSVADLEKHVLLRGETGTGKELVAAAIHRLSKRSDKKLVAINLPAVPSTLASSLLFGAEKGAYTGLVGRHFGYFEIAEGGTLFLDEIGDAPPELQVPLFRALESGEIQTVGSKHARKINVRVIAATDADLESKISEGSFRASLLNRLASYEIWIPALRDRREDIGRLLVSFLREELRKLDALHLIESRNGQEKPWLPAPLVATLVEFDWPGNVRQLKTVVEKLVIGNRGREQAELTQAVEHLFSAPVRPVKSTSTPAVVPVYVPVPVSAPAPTPAPEDETVAGPRDSVETSVPPHSDDNGAGRRRPADISEAELREAWQASEREGPRTAERLGISRASLYYLKERFPWLRMAKDLSVAEITECFFACNGDLALMADKLEVSERALTRRVKELELTLSSD